MSGRVSHLTNDGLSPFWWTRHDARLKGTGILAVSDFLGSRHLSPLGKDEAGNPHYTPTRHVAYPIRTDCCLYQWQGFAKYFPEKCRKALVCFLFGYHYVIFAESTQMKDKDQHGQLFLRKSVFACFSGFLCRPLWGFGESEYLWKDWRNDTFRLSTRLCGCLVFKGWEVTVYFFNKPKTDCIQSK